jgi:hypothetical protein
MNRNLRSLYILQTQTKINGNTEVVSNEDKYIYDEKSSKDIKKLQLDDDDIEKLRTLGFGMNNKEKTWTTLPRKLSKSTSLHESIEPMTKEQVVLRILISAETGNVSFRISAHFNGEIEFSFYPIERCLQNDYWCPATTNPGLIGWPGISRNFWRKHWQ